MGKRATRADRPRARVIRAWVLAAIPLVLLLHGVSHSSGHHGSAAYIAEADPPAAAASCMTSPARGADALTRPSASHCESDHGSYFGGAAHFPPSGTAPAATAVARRPAAGTGRPPAAGGPAAPPRNRSQILRC
ncbi:hypothetical protein BKA00_007355 [Actinomadura coerulea]|uniref:Uncharacterized protein n=1 Tax=Actinomadura coerulea TaxID=46159 RepID=A0A7X0L351_9ACTN|nr:hypothetical protein [Actinomadura coerulea]MBB6400441.1 hypothetical protein [Actinomadura coerulea]